MNIQRFILEIDVPDELGEISVEDMPQQLKNYEELGCICKVKKIIE